jgi:hypothetical protein
MRVNIYASPKLLIEHGKSIEEVLRKAVHNALKSHKRAGNTIAGWKDGQVDLIKAEDILIDSVIGPEQT